MEAFLGDFYARASERTRVSEMKQKCFSAQTLRKVENCETVRDIMEVLQECYCRPDRFVDEVLEPIRATKIIPDFDNVALELFYSGVMKMCADARELSEYKHLANPVVVGAVVDRLPTIELREWDVYRFSTEAAARNFTSELRCLEEFIARQLPGVRRLADRQRAVKAAGLSSGHGGKQGGGDKKNQDHFENHINVERKNGKAKEMFRVISSAAQATKPNSPNKPSKPQSSGNSKVQANAGGGGRG